MSNKSYEMNMCEGPLFGKIVVYSIPLILSGILQLLFNAADTIVVGRFAGSEALAAVGSTASLINLLTNVFMGLSIGSNVLIAKNYAAGREEETSLAVHTSILLSLICGVILMGLGIAVARPLLTLMGSPADVIDLSVLYIRIYFAGMPVMLLYNFGSAILRAVGDTKRPLYFLSAAGVINIILNLVFVILFQMSVAGVALATILSEAVSAALIVRCLIHTEGMCKLNLKKLAIDVPSMKAIIRLGLPAGMQGSIFSISNVLIQSSVNSFGSLVMAGNAAASNVEGFTYIAMNSVYQTALTFTSQNLGQHKFDRIKKLQVICLGMVTVVGVLLGGGSYLFGNVLLRFYSADAEVIRYGLIRMSFIAVFYFLCGIMDVMVGGLRGLGYSILPMIVSLLGACGFRIVWIFTIFANHRTLETLYLSYPISWSITAAVHVVCYLVGLRKMERSEMLHKLEE